MDKIQTQIVSILNAGIHGNKIDFNSNENIDWESIIEESKEHKVEALVYSAIGKDTLKSIDNELLEVWKKETFMSGVGQFRHIKNVSEFLSEFNKQSIPVIVLKGLVIRDLYPRPELRTMCDADLIIHKEDLEKVKNLLLNLGYIEKVTSDKDVCFIRGNTYVEIHWSIANEKSFNNVELFEEIIWKNAMKVKVGDSEVLSMCYEDLLVHICMHMAAHIKYLGFGIRQLCDLVLFVEKKGNIINWDKFIEKINMLGIYKFTVAIFNICNKLFDMEIPEILNKREIINDKYIFLLIEDIFSNGVHGKRDKASSFSKVISYANKEEKRSTLNSFKKLYFPSSDILSDKYSYAKSNKFLLPFAWIHRLFLAILNNKYSLKDKIKFMIFGMSVSKKRNNLISWLEL